MQRNGMAWNLILCLPFFKNKIQTFATKLLATGNKHLFESGSDFYACGLSITDKNVLDKSK